METMLDWQTPWTGAQRPAAASPAEQGLDRLRPRRVARVLSVQVPPDRPEWARQLADIGFTPGEPVQVLRRAAMGGDPLVARIGSSTFALRRAEAACVRVQVLD
ncbi:MAG TPA: FeoA family protein [Giesbergeria sp.]|nr:FeoA family protein [Giesbergeria sp.]